MLRGWLVSGAVLGLVACGGVSLDMPNDDAGDGEMAADATATTPDGSGPVVADDAQAPPPARDAGDPPPPVRDAGVHADASAPGTIACGASACSATTQDCCVMQGNESCVAKGTCMGGIALGCSSAASCAPGQVCCATQTNGGPSVSCETTCRGAELCGSDADCPSGETCVAIQGGLHVCRAAFPGDGGRLPPPGFDGGRPLPGDGGPGGGGPGGGGPGGG